MFAPLDKDGPRSPSRSPDVARRRHGGHRSREGRMTVQCYAIIRDEPIATETPKDIAPIRQFARMSTNVLMANKFAPLKVIVDGYLYEGFSVLAGRQKLGKTWLAIDWSVSVAAGGWAMGSIPCDAGDVVYIDLENGPRRIQS